ncbi:MAG: hypothetical protein JO223_11190 [Hyphomicrobiales bacterium]|nr:hypothetical protein [Hyphomicrobiales bacterium]
MAQGANLPWGASSDSLAWGTFTQVVAPSVNPSTPGVEFETWASDSDIYRTSPPQWPTAGSPKVLQISALGASHLRRGLMPQVIAPSECLQAYNKQAAAAAGFPADGCIGEEVRRNWASFRYIVSNTLYSIAGLKAAYASGLLVNLPADAIEVKGDWARVEDVENWLHISEPQVRSNYYVNKATAAGKTTEYALLAFHFSTKQIKNWVWADFENQLNPGRCDDIGCHDSFGAAIADVRALTPANQQYGECQKSPALQLMFDNAGLNKVWANYCLKGSQISFLGADGSVLLLGNSVIERINAGVPVKQSSCITCHAYASFDKDGQTNGPPDPPPVGIVDQSKLKDLATNDFIWGNLFAQ